MSALRLVVLVFALAACGGAKKPAPAAPAADPPAAAPAEPAPADGTAAEPEGGPGGEPTGGGAPKSSSDPCMGGE